MFKRSTIAVDKLCPKLEWLIIQTGANIYGCHLLTSPPDWLVPPFKEDAPRVEGVDAAPVFYYPQLDWLKDFAANKAWSWTETRPDVIVGFVPNHNFYSMPMSIGFFLSLYREINGEGAEVPFPGTDASWVTKSEDSSGDMIARQTIHITLSPEMQKPENRGRAFNVGDEVKPHCWREKWPALCALFGLHGVKRPEDNPIEVRKYIEDNYAVWEAMERKYGLQSGHINNARTVPGFEYLLLTKLVMDRQYDLSRLYGDLGFEEERTAALSWGGVFDRMKAANGTYLRELITYWQDGFDLRAQEAQINSFPQFQTEIDGMPIHFIHVRGKGPNPVPRILNHGWPWTFWDFKDIIMALADPGGARR